MPVTSELGSSRGWQEPMDDSTLGAQDSIDNRLLEEIHQLIEVSLGEGAAVCEACGEELREGASLVVFAFRPAEQSAFQLGHVKCTDCRHEPTEYFTLGVRELVVEGRVGTCSDPATQSSWPVLLAPQPRAVSPADTTTVQPLTGTTWFRRPITRSDVFVAADRVSTRKPWQRPVVRADTTDRESTPEPDSKTDDATDTPAPHAAAGGRQGGAR